MSTKFWMVNWRLSEYTSEDEFLSDLTRSYLIFLMPVMSFDIFNSAIKSVFCDKYCSLVDDKHCILIERVGAEKVFEASIFVSVRRSWTLFKSWIEIDESGWCCFRIVESWFAWPDEFRFTVLENNSEGGGGGIGIDDDLSWSNKNIFIKFRLYFQSVKFTFSLMSSLWYPLPLVSDDSVDAIVICSITICE